MTLPAEVVISMAGWHVDDGDREVRVGRPWQATVVLERSGPGTPDDWWPRITPAKAGAQPLLEHDGDDDRVPVYRFVATAETVDDHPIAGPWTALRVGPLVFGAPGAYSGVVQGRGHLLYDTYMIEGERVMALATQRFPVVRIQRLERRYVPGDRPGDHVPLPHEPPTDVRSTHERRPSAGRRQGATFATFLVHCSLDAPR